MTRIPFRSPRTITIPPLSLVSAAARIRTMATPSSSSSSSCVASLNRSGSLTVSYPKPVSPPYPSLSKEVELQRAVSAEERSASFVLAEEDHVVFEDEWFAVVNKPSGVYCETLLSSFASRCVGTEAVESGLHMANRLDRDTSGLMVLTKSNKAAGKFVEAFTNHEVKKTYLALCVGRAPKWERIGVRSGHGRSKFGAWRVYASSDAGRTLPGGSAVRAMATSFEVLTVNGRGEYKEQAELGTNSEMESIVVEERGEGWSCDDGDEKYDDDDEILVRAYPQSGRTHQIRLHCQYLGIPIRGDVKYGGVLEWKGIVCDGHALHAESLSFRHPITGEFVQFRAPAPLWLDETHGATSGDNA